MPPPKPPDRRRQNKPPPPPAPPPKRHPRQPYTPTDAHRSNVALMIAAGIDQTSIAQCLSITNKTLRKHYRRELDTAYAMIKADIAGKLIASARGGNIVAQMFYLERHGWVKSERLTVVDGGDEDVSTLSDAELEARIARLRRTAVVARAAKPS